MKSLIILAHPEPQSFNGSLAKVAGETLRLRGEVRVHDLYRQGFAAEEHARHFPQHKNPSRFDVQTEQRFNADQSTLPADVQREIDDLLWADFVLLQFPLWWFGMPAILKGWMDRVFVYGQLYSGSKRFDTGTCKGKRAILAVTAGSSAEACSPRGMEGDTRLVLWPVYYSLHYLGFDVLEPLLMTRIRGGFSGQAALEQDRYLASQLKDYGGKLAKLDAIPLIPFNSADDWDTNKQLKPDAPVYSPFIRHT